MTKVAGSCFAQWKVDERIQMMLKGSCFYNLTKFSIYKQRSDYLTHIVSFYDKTKHVFTVGQSNLYFGLQDVFAISGLPVDGRPLVCHDFDNTTLCLNMLGADEEKRDKNCGFLTRNWLKRNFEKVPQDTPDDQLVKYARAFLLHLIGGWVVTNSDKATSIPIFLLKFLEDVTPRELNSFAWGAAAHAQLHEILSRGRNNLNGPSWMLELFFFERIPEVAKSYFKLSSRSPQAIPQNRKIPLFLSWTPLLLKPSQNTRKVIDVDMRMINEKMTDEQIRWNPYVAYTNYEHQRIFHSKIPVFCYDIINYHRPDEVPRQLCVYNPQPLEDEVKYQSKSSRGHTTRNFPRHYADYLNIWEEKRYCKTMCVRDPDDRFSLPPEPTSDAENDVLNSGENDGVDHEDNDGAVVLTNETASDNLCDTTHVVNSGLNDEVIEALSRKRSPEKNAVLPLAYTRKVKRVKCLEHQGGHLKMQNIDSGDHVKLQPHKYLIESLLPVLKGIHEEQLEEIDLEARARGESVSSIKIEQVPCHPTTERIFWFPVKDITFGNHCLELLSRLKAGSDTFDDDRVENGDREEQIA